MQDNKIHSLDDNKVENSRLNKKQKTQEAAAIHASVDSVNPPVPTPDSQHDAFIQSWTEAIAEAFGVEVVSCFKSKELLMIETYVRKRCLDKQAECSVDKEPALDKVFRQPLETLWRNIQVCCKNRDLSCSPPPAAPVEYTKCDSPAADLSYDVVATHIQDRLDHGLHIPQVVDRRNFRKASFVWANYRPNEHDAWALTTSNGEQVLVYQYSVVKRVHNMIALEAYKLNAAPVDMRLVKPGTFNKLFKNQAIYQAEIETISGKPFCKLTTTSKDEIWVNVDWMKVHIHKSVDQEMHNAKNVNKFRRICMHFEKTQINTAELIQCPDKEVVLLRDFDGGMAYVDREYVFTRYRDDVDFLSRLEASSRFGHDKKVKVSDGDKSSSGTGDDCNAKQTLTVEVLDECEAKEELTVDVLGKLLQQPQIQEILQKGQYPILKRHGGGDRGCVGHSWLHIAYASALERKVDLRDDPIAKFGLAVYKRLESLRHQKNGNYNSEWKRILPHLAREYGVFARGGGQQKFNPLEPTKLQKEHWKDYLFIFHPFQNGNPMGHWFGYYSGRLFCAVDHDQSIECNSRNLESICPGYSGVKEFWFMGPGLPKRPKKGKQEGRKEETGKSNVVESFERETKVVDK